MSTGVAQLWIGDILASASILSLVYDATLVLLSNVADIKSHDIGIPGLTVNPVDLIEGYPTDNAPAFWRDVFRQKLAIVVFLLVAVTYNGLDYFIGFATEHGGLPSQKLITLTAAICILSISLISLRKREKVHRTTIHQLSLLLLAKLFYTALCVVVLPILEKKTLPPLSSCLLDGDIFATISAFLVSLNLPAGPPLHYPADLIYSKQILASLGSFPEHNVSSENQTSLLGTVLFNYVSDVFALGRTNIQVNLNMLPILPSRIRAIPNFVDLKKSTPNILKWIWKPKPGSGILLTVHLIKANMKYFIAIQSVALVVAAMFYAPLYFIKRFLAYLEADKGRENYATGLLYVFGIWLAQSALILVNGQLWTRASNLLRPRLVLQLNTMLYDKTLRRRETVSSNTQAEDKSGEGQFSSRSEVMNLMTTDVNRIVPLSFLCFSFTDTFVGISIGTILLYDLLGYSCFIGLGLLVIMMPLNNLVGRYVIKNQAKIMKIRDERVSLMNELLGAIRMIKFMAWESNFEERVLKVRNRELDTQRKKFVLEVIWNALGWTIPLIFTLSSYWHFALVRGMELTPSIAFTTIVVMGEMEYNLNTLPESLVKMLQAFISLGRVEKYLHLPEIETTTSTDGIAPQPEISLRSATVAWPRLRNPGEVSSSLTPNVPFSLVNVTTTFPSGQISLICGRIGSGKSLLLLGLLGEAEIIAGHVTSPRSEPDLHTKEVVGGSGSWLIRNMCAYVPQSPWLRNQTIKDNILFNMPFDAERYQQTIEACAFIQDLDMLEKGDLSEIGEQGINLSGGQKARVSLARAVYSKASTLFLDDVLSAVDAHTAKHLWEKCFLGPLLKGRTVILVSHHVQLCGPDAAHIVALDNGHIQYSGSWQGFQDTGALHAIVLSNKTPTTDGGIGGREQIEVKLENDATGSKEAETAKTVEEIEDTASGVDGNNQNYETTVHASQAVVTLQASDEETRQEGRISKDVWMLYFRSCGSFMFWALLIIALIMGAISPAVENVWLKIWSTADDATKRAAFFVGIYAVLVIFQTFIKISGWIFIYHGSITASRVLYADLLRMVLYAKLRFHDTLSRGRLLNRFGKDFGSIDNELPEELGRAVITCLGFSVSIISITYVGGWIFFTVTVCMLIICMFIAQSFAKISRDMQRLSSTTSSPLFSLYGETIAGLPVIRAFGMPSKFLRDMISSIDTQVNAYYWSTGLHRWLSVRFQLGSALLIGLVALLMFLNPEIDAGWAGLAIAIANTLTLDMYWFMRRFVEADQCMVALERVKEYMDIPVEPAHIVEPRPPAAWPTSGAIRYDNISVRYAPELPDVLHSINFEIKAGEKVGVIGRTGSGKSTLSLSLVRFMEARQGAIYIDGLDISKIGLKDLRSRVGIIPQDPILLSGTLRSALDIFEEYDDSEIYDALRRVNLLKDNVAHDTGSGSSRIVIASGFNNLDLPVSELGENFSTGERQLLCMARALLRRSKIMVMDEATASVDYATDEIISRTVREEFSDSTIITIAHRLRTIIDYDKIMILDGGRIVEFDRPATLMQNKDSKLYALCKATGDREFESLKAMAGV